MNSYILPPSHQVTENERNFTLLERAWVKNRGAGEDEAKLKKDQKFVSRDRSDDVLFEWRGTNREEKMSRLYIDEVYYILSWLKADLLSNVSLTTLPAIFPSRAYLTVFAETDDIENRIQIEIRDLQTTWTLFRHRIVIIISHVLWEIKGAERLSYNLMLRWRTKRKKIRSSYLLISINHHFIILRPNLMFMLYSTSFFHSSGIILRTP